MPVVIIKAIGGILVALTLISGGVVNIDKANKQTQQRNVQINEEIQEEIDELIDDYEYCEEVYINNLIHEGELEDELSEEDLEEIKSEIISVYSREYENRIHISDRTINHMRKQLNQKDQDSIERKSKLGGESQDNRIVYEWLKKFALN